MTDQVVFWRNVGDWVSFTMPQPRNQRALLTRVFFIKSLKSIAILTAVTGTLQAKKVLTVARALTFVTV